MDPTRLALTGALPMMLIIATVLSFPVSWLLLRLYRRAVLAAMNTRAGGPPPLPVSAAGIDTRQVPKTLAIRTVDHRAADKMLDGPLGSLWNARWITAATYALAGIVFAIVMTYGWLFATADPLRTWAKVLLLVWIYFWPTLLVINIVTATHTRARIANVLTYLGVFCVLWGIILTRNPDMGLFEIPMLWLIFAGPATVMLGAFMVRSLRAVGPLVLSFLVLAWAGAFAILVAFQQLNDAALRRLVAAGAELGLGALSLLWGPILIGFIVFALLGWRALKFLAGAYERARISDESLQIAAIMMLFAIVQSVSLALSGALWIFTGFVAFALWYACVRAGFALRGRLGRRSSPGLQLLLLRVFALGPRSERLFAGLQRVWLRQGSIAMIAGPDLATANIEPHEFLRFVRGRTREQFIDSEGTLDRRTLHIELRASPDGRHRVNEFFCYADTWQPTMRRLVKESDVVMMDLRAFSPAHQGCLWELAQLLDIIDLERVLFIVDHTTDRAFLDASLQQLWRSTNPRSPNRLRNTNPTATLFDCREPAERDLRALIGALLAAAKPAGHAPAAIAAS